MMRPIHIAKVCHEANRAYCESIGDYSQRPWREAPDWQQESALRGVEFLLSNPEATPVDTHGAWFADKQREGWSWGPVKSETSKTHPCMVPYAELPAAQRVKDSLFLSIVRALAPLPMTTMVAEPTTLYS